MIFTVLLLLLSCGTGYMLLNALKIKITEHRIKVSKLNKKVAKMEKKI